MPVKSSKVRSQPIRQAQGKKSKVQVKSKKVTRRVTAQTRTARSTRASGKSARSLTVDLYDVKGKVAGKVSLPKAIFAAKVNPVLMAQAVRVYLANRRKGTASTKTRGEVVASTRKIYRQKGTGRARHGAISAPIFVGGGVVFGPKPRDYSLALPKKMRRSALASALTSKLLDKAIYVVEGLEKIEPKTKIMHTAISNLRNPGNVKKNKQSVLLVIPEKVESVQRAARNIEGVTIRPVALLNTYDVLRSSSLLFMKDTIAKMEETWKKQTS